MTYGLPQTYKLIDPRNGALVDPELAGITYPQNSGLKGSFRIRTPAIECKCGCVCNCKVFPKIYQSTGHHDANGTEIFFGDVLVSDDGEFSDVQLKRLGIQMINKKGHTGPIDWANRGFYVCGNIHHSPEQLQAAAEKVSI